MVTLQDILKFAKEYNACSAQLNKFISFLEDGDELSAWQTVLGNLDWFGGSDVYGLLIDRKLLEKNADGIGKTWNADGQLKVKRNYKDGKEHGLYREWYDNGQLKYEANLIDDIYYGLERTWYRNGQLAYECNYMDGRLDGLFLRWDTDGKLICEENYNYGWKTN